MLILIDGYNVIAPVAAPGRGDTAGWLRAERQLLLDRLVSHLDERLLRQTCVVFDARAGRVFRRESRQSFHGLEVRFAVDHDEADDLIEELIAKHSAPKRLTVVTSDRRLQTAARRVGALACDAQPWLDALLDRRLWMAVPWPARDEVSPSDQAATRGQSDFADRAGEVPVVVEEWLEHFGLVAGQQRDAGESTARERGDAAERRSEKPSPSADADVGDECSTFPKGYGEDLLAEPD